MNKTIIKVAFNGCSTCGYTTGKHKKWSGLRGTFAFGSKRRSSNHSDTSSSLLWLPAKSQKCPPSVQNWSLLRVVVFPVRDLCQHTACEPVIETIGPNARGHGAVVVRCCCCCCCCRSVLRHKEPTGFLSLYRAARETSNGSKQS